MSKKRRGGAVACKHERSDSDDDRLIDHHLNLISRMNHDDEATTRELRSRLKKKGGGLIGGA